MVSQSCFNAVSGAIRGGIGGGRRGGDIDDDADDDGVDGIGILASGPKNARIPTLFRSKIRERGKCDGPFAPLEVAVVLIM